MAWLVFMTHTTLKQSKKENYDLGRGYVETEETRPIRACPSGSYKHGYIYFQNADNIQMPYWRKPTLADFKAQTQRQLLGINLMRRRGYEPVKALPGGNERMGEWDSLFHPIPDLSEPKVPKIEQADSVFEAERNKQRDKHDGKSTAS